MLSLFSASKRSTYKIFLCFLLLFPWVLLMLWPAARVRLRDGIPGTFPFKSTQHPDRPTELAPLSSLDLEIGEYLDPLADGYFRFNPRFEPLLQRYPNNLTVMALRLRYELLWPITQLKQGPLFSEFGAWSVALPQEPRVPPSNPDSSTSQQPPDAIDWSNRQACIALAKRGQQVEPDNAFWDWTLLRAYASMYRQSEFEKTLIGVAQKTRYYDYSQDELRAYTAWRYYKKGYFGCENIADILRDGHQLYPPPRYLRSYEYIAKWAAQLVMGARLQRQNKRALDMGLGMVRLGQLMRLGSFTPNNSVEGALRELYALQMARVDAGIYLKGPSIVPVPFSRPVVGGLNTYTPSLAALAQQQNLKSTRQFCLNQWNQSALWNLPEISSLASSQTYWNLGFSMRAVITIGASLWLLGISLLTCCRREADASSRLPQAYSLASGFLWALAGWALGLSIIVIFYCDLQMGFSLQNVGAELIYRDTQPVPSFLPIGMVLLGATLSARWRQWQRNRRTESELALIPLISWGDKPVRDSRPLMVLIGRSAFIISLTLTAILSFFIALDQHTNYRDQLNPILRWVCRQVEGAPFCEIPIALCIIPLLTLFLFVALCRKPEAKEARREMRLLLRDYTLGAFIGGSWLVLAGFIVWLAAEDDFARQLAPFDKGQAVHIMAQKAGLKWQ